MTSQHSDMITATRSKAHTRQHPHGNNAMDHLSTPQQNRMGSQQHSATCHAATGTTPPEPILFARIWNPPSKTTHQPIITHPRKICLANNPHVLWIEPYDFLPPQQCNSKDNNPATCSLPTSLEVKVQRTSASNRAKILLLRTLTDKTTLFSTVAGPG